MAVGSLNPNDKPILAAVVDEEGKRYLELRKADGRIRRQRLSENFKSNPKSMALHDLNQDGLGDVVVLIPFEKVKVLIQTEGMDFEEADVAPPGGSADQPWLSASDVDGDGKPELLLAQKNFLRAVTLHKRTSEPAGAAGSTWAFQVKDQINGAASSSTIVGAAALRNGTNGVDSIFLLDAERKSLTLSERDAAGVWQVARNMPLPVTDFTGLQPIALGGATPNAVAFFGNTGVAWMPLRGEVWELADLDGYESPIKDSFLLDVISGDLNHDGRKDLVFLETRKNYIDVVTFEPPHRLVPANRWQVFEERTFRARRNEAPEPREALIVDINNDGKNDLVVLVHDRIIVYPQE